MGGRRGGGQEVGKGEGGGGGGGDLKRALERYIVKGRNRLKGTGPTTGLNQVFLFL